MKKFLLGSLLLAGFSAACFATYTNYGSEYKTPILKTALNFQASYANGKVSTSRANIDTITNNSMTRYKVVKSQTNHFPVYPEDKYIAAISNRSQINFVETNPENGTRYYRVCAIMEDMNRYCSNVVELTINTTATTTTTTTTTTSTLTANMKTVIDGLVVAFMNKIENKYPNNLSGQLSFLETFVSKIGVLTTGKYGALFSYLKDKLEEQVAILRIESLLTI